MMRVRTSPRFNCAAGQAPLLRQEQPPSHRGRILRAAWGRAQNGRLLSAEGYFEAASSSAAALSRTPATLSSAFAVRTTPSLASSHFLCSMASRTIGIVLTP